jgi:ferredoxin-NADP reductase
MEAEVVIGPKLQVVHVLSRPKEAWPGEKGHLDREKIARLCGDRLGTAFFFLCCPPPLIHTLVPVLRDLAVADARIHFEYFSL